MGYVSISPSCHRIISEERKDLNIDEPGKG